MLDHVDSLLNRRNKGLSSHHVHQEVMTLSDVHSRWNQEMTFSLLHGDPRFRFSQSGAVGLSSWDSTRVPTRLELARQALSQSGGRVSVDAVLDRIEANYGVRPNRGLLASVAVHLNASLAGDWLVLKD